MNRRISVKKEAADRLSPKQRRFCEVYIDEYNGTRAYKAVYKGVKNDNVAGACSSKLLRNPKIQAYISELERNLARTVGVSKKRIANEYKKLAFSNISDYHSGWITRKEFDELTEDQKAAIAEIQTETRTILDKAEGCPVKTEYVKIKLHDKPEALKTLWGILGFEPDKRLLVDLDFSQFTNEQLQMILDELLKKVK